MEQYIVKSVVLLVLILMDIVTGLAAAFYLNQYNSSVMREGAYHKLCEVFVVIFSTLADVYLPVLGVDIGVEIAPLTVIYFAVMEICSIIENVGKISPDAVKPISKYFEKLKGEHNV